jgi:hypothetical protein
MAKSQNLESNSDIDAAVRKLLNNPTAEDAEDLREALKVAITWEKVKFHIKDAGAGSAWDDPPPEES